MVASPSSSMTSSFTGIESHSPHWLSEMCKTNDPLQVREAIRRGARPDSETLTLACLSGHHVIFDAIIHLDAKPDDETLNAACIVKQPRFVEQVIALGAKPSPKTRQLAHDTQDPHIIDQIERLYAAELPAHSSSVATPVFQTMPSSNSPEIQPSTIKKYKILKGHTNPVYTASFSLARSQLLSFSAGYPEGNLKIWDMTSGKCVDTINVNANALAPVICRADGKTLIANNSAEVEVWDFSISKKECLRRLQGHSKTITAMVLLPDGTLVTGSTDTHIKWWDILTGSCQATSDDHKHPVTSLAVHPSGMLLSSDRSGIKFWNLSTTDCMQTIEDTISSFAVFPNGRIGYTNGSTLKIVDPHTKECVKTLEISSADFLNTLSNKLVVTTDQDKKILFWNSDGQVIHSVKAKSTVRSLTVTHDGIVVAGRQDGKIQIWKPKTADF